MSQDVPYLTGLAAEDPLSERERHPGDEDLQLQGPAAMQPTPSLHHQCYMIKNFLQQTAPRTPTAGAWRTKVLSKSKRLLIKKFFGGQNRYFQQLLEDALSYNPRQPFRSCSRLQVQRFMRHEIWITTHCGRDRGSPLTGDQRRLRRLGIFQVLPST